MQATTKQLESWGNKVQDKSKKALERTLSRISDMDEIADNNIQELDRQKNILDWIHKQNDVIGDNV